MANQYRDYLLTINNPFVCHFEQIKNDSYSLVSENEYYISVVVKNENNEEYNTCFYHSIDSFFEYVKSLDHIKYAIFQLEKGEGDDKQQGTEHLQIYLEFSLGKRFEHMKKLFPRAHVESRRGSKKQARAYCSKEDTRLGDLCEFGEFVEVGERSDLNDIIELVKQGVTDEELYSLYPSQMFRYYKNVNQVRQSYLSSRYKKVFRNLEVIYIFGSPGVGKTRYVMEKYGYENVYRLNNYGRGCFDGYEGQDVVVFEEFYSQFNIVNILNYLDGYPLMLPCRYNDKVACYTKVYIISNNEFSWQYKLVKEKYAEQYKAWVRRIHKIYKMNSNGELEELDKAFDILEKTELTKDEQISLSNAFGDLDF